MDVSTSARIGIPDHHEICCDVCGYPRLGLPPESRCPECGEPPPVAVQPMSSFAGAASDRADQAWLASVAIGLGLLVFTSIITIHVTIAMSIGGLVLVAVNAPGPKLAACALIQRSVGRPGEWGVLGTLAVLGSVLAIWLITEPRSIWAGDERFWSLRRVTRWTCILTAGALLGAILGGYAFDTFWGWNALPLLAVIVGLVELPVNTLLYCHLARLSKRFVPRSDRARSLPLLRAACWLVPLACAAGVGMSIVRWWYEDEPVVFWRVIQSIYGSLALAVGMVMTAATLHLLAKVVAAASDRSVVSLAGKLARLRRSVGRFVGAVRAHPARAMAVAGLVLWLWNTRPLVGTAAMIEHRRGLGGDLPLLNFIGPKVWAVPLLEGSFSRYYASSNNRLAVITTILVVWMITTLRPPGARPRVSLLTRWIPTLLIGMAVGLSTAIALALEVRRSYWAAGLMIGVEAPATFLVYLYLARLARFVDQPQLARHLKAIAFTASAIIVSPLLFYVLSRPTWGSHNHPLAIAACALYGAVVISAGVLAWALIVRLTWSLATARLSSPQNDPGFASADAQQQANRSRWTFRRLLDAAVAAIALQSRPRVRHRPRQ
jgi:hypothetical protein